MSNERGEVVMVPQLKYERVQKAKLIFPYIKCIISVLFGFLHYWVMDNRSFFFVVVVLVRLEMADWSLCFYQYGVFLFVSYERRGVIECGES